MSALLIKNLPPPLHEKLRQRAAANHRSMNREVLAMLERELSRSVPYELPPPIATARRVSGELVVQIIREARDGKR